LKAEAALLKKIYGVGIGPFSKILAVKVCLIWAEIEHTVHVALHKTSSNQFSKEDNRP
jgi:hypothetical protein